MFKYLRLLPVLALAGMLGLLHMPGAAAQATNLDCNKCVDKGDIAKKAVKASKIAKDAVKTKKIKDDAVTSAKIEDGTVALADLSPEVQQIIADLQAQVAAMEALMAVVIVEDVGTDLNGNGVIEDVPVDLDGDGLPDAASEFLPTVRFEGVNLQVVNGDPSEDTSSLNALGNLIVGYNEPRTERFSVCSDGQFDNRGDCRAGGHVWALNHKSGSHNLVVGPENAYSQTGGAVFGESNAVNRAGASVTAGRFNLASGPHSSVSGGDENLASGDSASVTGGNENIASFSRSTVGGDTSSDTTGPGEWVAGVLSSAP